MSTRRLRSRGLSPSSQGRSSSASSSAVPGGGSSSQRRSARLESCPTSSQVQGRREREQRRGCPPAPHNSLDQSVILLDDILALQESTLEEVFGAPAPALPVSGGRGGERGGRPVPTFLEDPAPAATRRPRYSEEDLAAHHNAINRALGLGLTVSQTDSPPDTEDQDQDVDLIEIEDTTEEDILLSEEEQGSQAASRSPQARSQVSSPTETYRLELTIDLTDSPTTSLPVFSPASQSRSPAQLSNPPSPALQCPVCLDTFSAIRSRGLQLVSTVCGHVFCRQCLQQCIFTQQQCPTCRRRLGYQDYHPLFL